MTQLTPTDPTVRAISASVMAHAVRMAGILSRIGCTDEQRSRGFAEARLMRDELDRLVDLERAQ